MRANAEFARWREAARMVAGTLAGSGRLTPPGETFVEGMTRSLDAWAAEPVTGEAAALAREAAERHRTRWQQRNGRVASL